MKQNTKTLQTHVYTQTTLGGITYPPVAKVYMCQKLLELVGSKQSYYNSKNGYFLTHAVYIHYVSV